MKAKKEIEFDLFENGLDFIDYSLNPILESSNKNDLKYSILHISAGVELILKEILKCEHWSLIFEKVDTANYSKLCSGDFQSVSIDMILNRLENITSVEISESAKNHIKELRRKRNKIEHFAFKENEIAIKSNISEVLSNIIEIISENIQIKNYSTKSQFLYKSIIKKAAKFNEFVILKNEKVKPLLKELEKNNVIILNCPECFQPTFPLSEKSKCLFCGYSDTPEEIAHSYLENICKVSEYAEVKSGGYFPLENCPICENRSLIVKNNSYLCFNCCKEWSSEKFGRCSICDELFVETPHSNGFCNGCENQRTSRAVNDK